MKPLRESKELSMRIVKAFSVVAASVLLYSTSGRLLSLDGTESVTVHAATSTPNVAVGPQYDTTHVYVAPEDFDRFVASLVATFGGTTSKQGVFTVTPTPSNTMSQVVLTPAGSVSVFGFKTPIPYPFGAERSGYLVTNMDTAVQAARIAGADVTVTPFNDPIGRDTIIQWPGGSICSSTGIQLLRPTKSCKPFQKTVSMSLPIV